ncbi:MAG: cation ABC transporter substrate-binding protein [candidate division Zixibacteria bacterium]|nr:cation ABC transporter substrate-binding protein [candidate division Zixibacteria bacterium]
MPKKALILAVLLIWILIGNVYADGKTQVTVSILPQKNFVEKIAGGLVDVQAMVPPGASPAVYEPKPSQMARLSRSKVYFAIGVPFEKTWLGKFAHVNGSMSVVRTDEGIEKNPMEDHHHHGSKGALDPHVWLSPRLVKKQVAIIRDALIRIDGANEQTYRTNYEKFIREIDRLDADIKEILKGVDNRSFMVFHPTWGYFARDYGLTQVPIEIEGKEPKPAQLKEIIKTARAKNIGVVFVQPQFSMRSARVIADEIGAKLVELDPLAENWKENLLEAANTLKEELAE